MKRIILFFRNCSLLSTTSTSRGLSAGSRNLCGSLDPADKPRDVGRGRAVTFFLCIFVGATGFAERIVLDNQSLNFANNQKSKIAIQWAISARDAEASNHALSQGLPLNAERLQTLTQEGKINLDLPKQAEYFRVLIWTKDSVTPDLITNWVDIVPSKTYTLNKEHLIPLALMSGTGC